MKVTLAPWQYAALVNPFQHFAMFGGVAVGKTFTGSHFALYHITHFPDYTGLIGANNHDQLSQATLKELYYWLHHYGFEYVSDCQPPKEWGMRRSLKKYMNTMHVRNPFTGKVTLIFTRILSDGDALRGIEISWYWMDETRDTPEDTHDTIVARCRETPGYIKGIITTTTNGEDWGYQRFVLNGNMPNKIFGSMHVGTIESVRLGIITQEYYDTMVQAYDPLKAQQELGAEHINIFGGKAYHAASDANRRALAPWGAEYPDPEYPLIIGCDFNFSPAPLVWMVGQLGPGEWSDHIHWFSELSDTAISTVEMTKRMIGLYPGFFFRIFGDMSGGIGTTSNAGQTDYDQMGETLDDAEEVPGYSIDAHQLSDEEARMNPRVRSRVENMNRMLKNGAGEIHMTYDPSRCVLFDNDMKNVGWKKTTSEGKGKLDAGGDNTRTHASDAAGYAVWKLFPPGRKQRLLPGVASAIREEHGITMDVHTW